MHRFTPITGLRCAALRELQRRLRNTQPRRGRPWASSLERRLTLVCTSLRTNLTLRELAAVFDISKSQVHRIVADLVPRLAALLPSRIDPDHRWSWVVDGTLIPTRDHQAAAKSKNYRWSCNAQLLARRRDLRVIAIVGGGPGNRHDRVHDRGSLIELSAAAMAASSRTAAIAA